MAEGLFEHAGTFEAGEISGNVRLGRFEAQYEELFSHAYEDGVITTEERAQLDKAASAMGLDRERVHQVERALSAAWHARHREAARVDLPPSSLRVSAAGDASATSLRPLEIEADPHVKGLRRRIVELEARVKQLEADLEEARSHINVEVDFSGLGAAAAPTGDPEELYRRVRHDARDADVLHALFAAVVDADEDRALRVARALAFLGAANEREHAVMAKHPNDGLIRPASSLTPETWKRNLFHPDEELLTGEIFAVVTSPVLLGRVTTLRQQNLLPKLDPSRLQDPRTSTLQAVRCFSWAASILGMGSPALYADPGWEGVAGMVPGLPPASRLGKFALSGRSPAELAFAAGRHLASYREDHFLRLLFPSIPDLEDIFLAALTIGQPQLPLAAGVKARAVPIAQAIQPLLEPAHVDRLRGHFLRFVEEGGRTNLLRWANGADMTATRAGLLLADDLGASARMLKLEAVPEADAFIDDLIVFYVGDRCSRIRKQIGIAVS